MKKILGHQNSLIFPWFWKKMPNSLTFPWLEKCLPIFPDFPDFQKRWEPWWLLPKCKSFHLIVSKIILNWKRITCDVDGSIPVLISNSDHGIRFTGTNIGICKVTLLSPTFTFTFIQSRDYYNICYLLSLSISSSFDMLHFVFKIFCCRTHRYK